MPKILHIGGVDSPHVIGITEQIKQNTDFQQVIVSYPTKPKPFYVEALKGINTYFYNYPMFFTSKALPPTAYTKMIAFVLNVINKEKPDIIHGHYLSKCAVIMSHFMKYSKKPGIVVPWSIWDIPTNKEMIARNKQCVAMCKYVMCTNLKFLYSMLDFFGQSRAKGVFSFPPIRLYLYNNSVPDTRIPKLFITRKHYQNIFFSMLPKVIAKFPNLQITSLSPDPIIDLSRKLGIHDKINFLPGMLPQDDFAKLLQQHNIVRSMAPDHGTSSTTIQAAYSGAVTLVHKSPWDVKMFTDKVNVLKCDITAKDMEDKLTYAIQNLPALCTLFKKNNAFLKQWDAEVTWKNLHTAYKTMLRTGA